MPQFSGNMYSNPKQNQAMGGGNVSSSYFEMLFKNLMGGGDYGRNEDALARAHASSGEDEALRGMLGSSRKKKKGENMPEGSYSLYNYPGLEGAIDWASTGNAPAGAGTGSTTGWLREQQDQSYGDSQRQGRRDWARNQAQIIGRGW